MAVTQLRVLTFHHVLAWATTTKQDSRHFSVKSLEGPGHPQTFLSPPLSLPPYQAMVYAAKLRQQPKTKGIFTKMRVRGEEVYVVD